MNSLENFGHLRRLFNLEHCLLAILILDADSDGLGAPLWLLIFSVGHCIIRYRSRWFEFAAVMRSWIMDEI